MRILPYQRLTLVSALQTKELLERLRASTRAQMIGASADNPAKTFVGTIGEDHFMVQRSIGYRNSFNPQLSGRIHVSGNLSTIDLTIRLHPTTSVFIGVWCGILLLVVTAKIAAAMYLGSIRSLPLVPPVMLAVGYMITMVGFGVERGKALSDLKAIAEATKV